MITLYSPIHSASLTAIFWFFVLFCFIHLSIFGCVGLSLVAVSGGYSSLRCAGFSLRWLLFLAEHGL